MPKRDAAYMRAQRDMIARATLDVLLEKGVYDTSLRDICKAAGISIGALYIHFTTKDEAIVAACSLDHEERKKAPPTESWREYIDTFLLGDLEAQLVGRIARRFRVSLQFVAELTQYTRNPPGLSVIYQVYREHLSASLEFLKAKGELTLPLGLEQTAELHMQIVNGARYQICADRDLPFGGVMEAAEVGLALTAGRV